MSQFLRLRSSGASVFMAMATACTTSNYDAITGGHAGSGGTAGSFGGVPTSAGAPATANAGSGFGGTDAGSAGSGGSGGATDFAGAAGTGGAAAGSTGAAGDAGTAGAGGGADAGMNEVCTAAGLSPGDTNETVQVGSATRTYFLHVPESYDGTRPVPLIVDFHFLGNSGEQEQLISPFPATTADEGVIVAYPDGTVGPGGRAWNLGPCCVSDDVDDVAFSKALVDQLRGRACIDEKRVYAVGFALGGGMAHALGCQAADVFAAVVPVGFDLLAENSDECAPSRPITVVHFRELSDVIAPYEGGVWTLVPDMPVTLLGAEATFARWAELDGCVGPPSDRDANGCAFYEQCMGDVEVVLCTKEAGVPVPDNGRIAWPILQRHALP